MKEKEPVQEFLSRVPGIVSHMKTYSENVSNETIVSKVLRITKDFDHVVGAIEESKDLSNYIFDVLMSSLLAYEARFNRSHEKVEEKAFQVTGETSVDTSSGRAGSNHGRSGFQAEAVEEAKEKVVVKEAQMMKGRTKCHFTVITAKKTRPERSLLLAKAKG